MSPVIVIPIVQAILKYGPDAVILIADLIKSKDEITPEDINNLFITKDPEDYFR